MTQNKNILWKSPAVKTIENEQVVTKICASACSNYFESCWPMMYLGSIPGLPDLDVM